MRIKILQWHRINITRFFFCKISLSNKIKIYTLKKLDKNHEAVKELELIKNREDVALGAMLALVYTHRKFSSIGKIL